MTCFWIISHEPVRTLHVVTDIAVASMSDSSHAASDGFPRTVSSLVSMYSLRQYHVLLQVLPQVTGPADPLFHFPVTWLQAVIPALLEATSSNPQGAGPILDGLAAMLQAVLGLRFTQPYLVTTVSCSQQRCSMCCAVPIV
jgi:hypothetical protein